MERWLARSAAEGDEFDPCSQLEQQLGELVDRQAIRRQQQERAVAILSDRSTLPGVTDFITRAIERGMLLAVASGSPSDWVEAHLDRLALRNYFHAIQCSPDANGSRPDAQIYLDVCNALDVTPQAAIAIEDSPTGIAAAKKAGLYCVSVPNALTRSVSMDGADMVLVSLSSITLDEVVEHAARQRQ